MSSLDFKFIKNKPYKVSLAYGKYQTFWQRMATPTTASSYLAELLGKVMHLESGKKQLKQDDLIELEMIATMYGLALNHQIGDLQGIKLKSEDISKKAEPIHQKIITNIKMLIEQRDIISSIISQCCFAREMNEEGKPTLDPFAYFKTVKRHADHTSSFYQALRIKELEILDTGEFSFTYEYLVKYMSKNKRQITPELVKGVTQAIKSIKMSLKESPEAAQIGACAITHLVRQIITFYPTNEIEILKEFAAGIETFRKWPLPVGIMADTCFKIIMNEMRSPGAMYRDYMRENFPLVDFLRNDNGDFDETLSHIVHCFTEETLEVDDILNYNSYNLETESRLDPHYLRSLVIAYILSSTTDDSKALITEVISGLNFQEVFIIYTRMLHVLEKASELDNITECKNVQKTTFNELLREIKKDEQASNKSSLIKVFKDNPSLVAPIPVANLRLLERPAEKGKDSYHKKTLSGAFDRRSTVQDQLAHVDKLSSFVLKILAILEASKKPDMPLHEGPVKFMIIGGEAEIYNFIQDLLKAYENRPHLFRRADLRLYLVPTSHSPITHYLAARDYWYQRYIYIPFLHSPILPKMEYTPRNQQDFITKSVSDISTSDKRTVFPALMKENLLQSFVREANFKFCPVVYQAKCFSGYYDDTKEIKPDKIIYFFQYIDIGAGVMRYKQRLEKKLPSDTPFYDLEGNKLIKKFYLDLKIKAEYCEMSGYTHKSDEVVIRSIHDLSINNVPREYIRSALPYPTSGWLEVSYLDFENFKYEDNAMKDKDKFKKLKPDHINAAFSALYTNIHVKKISIWTNDREQAFDFVIDGQLTEHYRRIDISPVKILNHPSGPYFTLPFATFFPVQM